MKETARKQNVAPAKVTRTAMLTMIQDLAFHRTSCAWAGAAAAGISSGLDGKATSLAIVDGAGGITSAGGTAASEGGSGVAHASPPG
jgi:hypothetical protein